MYCAAMHLETTWIYHIRTKFLLIPGKQAHSSFYADAFSFKRTCDFVHDRKKIGFTSRAPCRPCAGTYVCSSSHVHIIASILMRVELFAPVPQPGPSPCCEVCSLGRRRRSGFLFSFVLSPKLQAGGVSLYYFVHLQ